MPPATTTPLEQRLAYIARQYRRRRLLGGLVRWLGAAVVILLGLHLGLVLAAELALPFALPFGLAALLMLLLAWRWLYPPFKLHLDPVQVALLIDRRHPQLEDLTTSSLEFGQGTKQQTPAWIADQVQRQELLRSRQINLAELVDPRPLRRLALGNSLVGGLGLVLSVILVHSWGIDRLSSRLWHANPYLQATFTVQPGDTRVRRGSDQTLWITNAESGLGGAIRWRAAGQWQSAALLPGAGEGVYYFQLRNLQTDTDYQIQLGNQRSALYRLSVWTPPALESVALTYNYPSYLNLPPRLVEDGGDIAAPESTAVEIEVQVNKPLEQAALKLDSGSVVSLHPTGAKNWSGQLLVSGDDRYQLALQDAAGDTNSGQWTYTITLVEDRPPAIRLHSPGGDDEATPLEEIPFRFAVSDDFALAGYGLQYQVAGRPAVRLPGQKAKGPTAEGEFLLALEDLNLEPGDLVTWHLWAEDYKPHRPAYQTLGDPYFLEIRPFERTFRQATSNQGASQSGGQGAPAADQKQIIIATWNLRRDAAQLDTEEFAQRRNTIAAAQEGILADLNPAGPAPELTATLTEALTEALKELAAAHLPDPAAALSQALGHQQRAYHLMLRLQPSQYDLVQQSNNPANGGAGRPNARQRELDALETTRRRDFSEAASTLERELASMAQARSDIEELARRQALINEDLAQLLSEQEKADDQDQQVAKRQLERLQEQQRRNLADLDRLESRLATGPLDPNQARQTRQQLDQARRQMRRSADNLAGDQMQQARAASNRALDNLQQAQDNLAQFTAEAAAQRLGQLDRQLDSLQTRQRQLAGRAQAQSRPGPLTSSRQTATELREAQQELAATFKQVLEEAGEVAEKSRQTQGLMARKLGDWLRRTSGEGIYEDMLSGDEALRRGAWEEAAQLEEAIADRLAAAAAGFDSLKQFLVRDQLDSRQKALTRLEGLLQQAQTDSALPPQQNQPLAPYDSWNQTLRDAEDLLPQDSPVGAQLADIRQGLGALERHYRQSKTAPSFDLVFDRTIKPLTLAAETLRRELAAMRDSTQLSAAQTETIPPRYRARVAEYFKALAEQERQ